MTYINKKLKNILSSFSPQEIAEFKKFAASPVHSERRSYVPIINWMVSLQNRRTSKKLGFPSGPLSAYNQQTLRNRQSELLKLAFEFLILKSLSKSSLEREKLLLKELSERGLQDIFSARMRKTKDLVNSLQVDDRKFELVDELMQLEVSHYMNTNKFEKVYPLYFENSFHYACMTFVVLYAFGMEYEMQSMLNKKYEFNIVRDILSMCDFSKLKIADEYKSKEVYLTAKLHYCLYIATSDLENESYYHESRKIFSKLIPDLSVSTTLGIYKWMINYCVRRMNTGRRNFVNELFILFNEKLKAGLFQIFQKTFFQ